MRKNYIENLAIYIQDVLAWLRSFPEHQRMILALASMGLAVVLVYSTWNIASSPLVSLHTDNIVNSESITLTPAQKTDSPTSGIIESFKDIEAVFFPANTDQQKSPGAITAMLSETTKAFDWTKEKLWIYFHLLADKTKIKLGEMSLYFSQLLIFYTSRTAK